MGSLCLCRWVTNVVRPPLSWWTLTRGPKGVADGLTAPWDPTTMSLCWPELPCADGVDREEDTPPPDLLTPGGWTSFGF